MSREINLKGEYTDLWNDLRSYFRGYGGIRKVVCSPFTHGAIVLTLLSWSKWHAANWMTIPLAVLPALLGFTLAAYALLLGFGDESFRRFLASIRTKQAIQHGDDSTLMGISAVFLHFVIVEIVALSIAILGDANVVTTLIGKKGSVTLAAALHLRAGSLHHGLAFVGIFAFYLSVLMSLAAAIDIYHATRWYVRFNRVQSGNDDAAAKPHRGPDEAIS